MIRGPLQTLPSKIKNPKVPAATRAVDIGAKPTASACEQGERPSSVISTPAKRKGQAMVKPDAKQPRFHWR
jgi:hypothetical protein